MQTKNPFLTKWLDIQDWISMLACFCMITGWVLSRALLSISILIIFLNALHPAHIRSYFEEWKHNKMALGCLLFFCCYLISALWSQNLSYWWSVLAEKIPLLLLPFAFFSVPLHQRRWQRTLILFLLLVHTLVIFYSIGSLILNWHFYLATYGQSFSIPTTKYNDHIRFSLSIVACLVIICYNLFFNKTILVHRLERMFLWFSGILFFLYLHLLASKTGVVLLYVSLFAFVLYGIKTKIKWRKVLWGVLGLFLCLPFLLYFTIPTFHERVNYVRYEWRESQGQELSYNLSDAGRVISYKVAMAVWSEHKLLGTGAGDLRDKMDQQYARLFPKVPAENRLVPHSQFLYDFVALGPIFGLGLLALCFSVFIGYEKPRFFGRLTAFLMVLAMLAEAMLEVQFGLFLFLFYLLFWQRMPKCQI